jgi:hypothetical protein
VIRFEQQQIRTAEMEADGIGEIAEIGGNRDLDALGAEGEADRIGRIVRNGETGDIDVADREACAGLEEFEVRRVFIPQDGGRGEARNIDRDAELAGYRLKTVDMIGMLMRDQNRGEGFGIVAGGFEPLESFLAGEAGVD